MNLFEHLATAAGVTGPILLLLACGIAFRRVGLIDGAFVAVGNRLTYLVALPCLLFLATATRPLEESFDGPLVLFGLLATLAAVVLLWWFAPLIVARERRGVFVQNGFRGNMAVVGLALCVNAYGQTILPLAGVYMALVVILYNLVAVAVLSGTLRLRLPMLARNPIVLGLGAGLAWSATGLTFPPLLERSAGYFAQLALPLALLCIGGSLDWRSFHANRRDLAWSAAAKLVVVPAATTLAALALGFRGSELGVIYLMVASPTAATSYVMATQMTKHGALAAESVAVTTALCPFTIAAGFVLLSYAGVV